MKLFIATDNLLLLHKKNRCFWNRYNVAWPCRPEPSSDGPCWPQLSAVSGLSGIKLSDPNSNTSLEIGGKFRYLAIRLRTENYEMKLRTTVAIKIVTFWGCDAVWTGDWLYAHTSKKRSLSEIQKLSYPEVGKGAFLRNTDQLLPDRNTNENYICELSLTNDRHNLLRSGCLHVSFLNWDYLNTTQ